MYIYMLSTYHGSDMIKKTRRSRHAQGGVEDIEKPRVVEDYNQQMGSIDRSDLI